MKRLLTLMLALLLVLVAALPLARAEEEKVLNFFSWATYIDDDTVARFTEKTGIKVNYATFASNEEMLLKMASAGNEYDVILASDYAINILRKDGKLQMLNKELLPNYQNLDPAFLGQYYDENNEYTVPYTAGTQLIVEPGTEGQPGHHRRRARDDRRRAQDPGLFLQLHQRRRAGRGEGETVRPAPQRARLQL